MLTYVTNIDTDARILNRIIPKLPHDFTKVVVVDLFRSGAETSSIEQSDAVIIRVLTSREALDAVKKILHQARPSTRIVAFSGERHDDLQTAQWSTVSSELRSKASEYVTKGGSKNFYNFLLYISNEFFGTNYEFDSPQDLPWCGLYHPQMGAPVDLPSLLQRHDHEKPTVGILFYRAYWISEDLEPIDELIYSLEAIGCNVLPIFTYSLREDLRPERLTTDLKSLMQDDQGRSRIDCLVSLLSFSTANLSSDSRTVRVADVEDFFKELKVPVIQGLMMSSSEAQWISNSRGLSPIDLTMKVVLPEFDGRIISTAVSSREISEDRALGPAVRNSALKERMGSLAGLVYNYAKLRWKANKDKRIAIILTNYPAKNSRIGNAVGLDTAASALNVLYALKREEYSVGELPLTSDQLMQLLTSVQSNEEGLQIGESLSVVSYRESFERLSEYNRSDMKKFWGDPPGGVLVSKDRILVPGIVTGNIFVGIQPSRGFGENPVAIYHSPDMPPNHQYYAFYEWIRNCFKADAIIHLGKHGNLEWLPGKSVALSSTCYPEALLRDVPHFYPFIVNNPGEGTQAKRRSHAVIIDHLIPVTTTADSYGELAKMEQLIDEYFQMQSLDPSKLPIIEDQIWHVYLSSNLNADLDVSEKPSNFGEFLTTMDAYLCELKLAQIKDGLHTLGEVPEGQRLTQFLISLTRIGGLIPSLRRSVAEQLEIPYPDDPNLYGNRIVPLEVRTPSAKATLRTLGDCVEFSEKISYSIIADIQSRKFSKEAISEVVQKALGRSSEKVSKILEFLLENVVPKVLLTHQEIDNLLAGLRGEYVPSGPSGSPTRGMLEVLPTGRNFYSVDARAIPSPSAWEVGKRLGDELLNRFRRENSHYPETVAIVLWGTANMRTHGDDIAEILWLLGVKPVWQKENNRVIDLDVIPTNVLGRPRIDVAVRISGFFRDAFPNVVEFLNQAFRKVAFLEEPHDVNFVAKHFVEETERLKSRGITDETAEEKSLHRIFGSKPGTYGVGILQVIQQKNWKTDDDLANVFMNWAGYAYSTKNFGSEAKDELRSILKRTDAAVKNQDNREHDIFDSDDYFQEHGGLIAAIRSTKGKDPAAYFGDSADPSRSRVLTLKEEALRVFRSRVINPKWIRSMTRHGYRGAAELASTVDYMFGYDATAHIIDDWMYEKTAESFIINEDMRRFLQEKNPWALRDMTERLLEAIQRRLWEAPRDDMKGKLNAILNETNVLLEGLRESDESSDRAD